MKISWFPCAGVFVLAIFARLVTLNDYPLTDTTEARYAEIARVMVTTTEYLTPQLEPGVPFWAKPPLSFWQSAISMKLLGVSEFSARLPSFLNIILALTFTYLLAIQFCTRFTAFVATIIVLTSAVGFVSAGAVMTDSILFAALSLSMLSFWIAFTKNSRRFSYVFFVSISIGILAKGPIAIVLTATPVYLWLLWEKQILNLPKRIPLATGSFLLLAISLPWFLIAEYKTEGFLNYYLIGEHLSRFIDSGWEGDRYGNAHDEPRGTIWLFGFQAFAPWSFIALILLAISTYHLLNRSRRVKLLSIERYLVIWALTPFLFFSFSGNILPAYALPSLSPFAILLAISISSATKKIWFIVSACFVPIVFLLAEPLGFIEKLNNRSQAEIISEFSKDYANTPIIYIDHAPHSARFYSNGEAIFLSRDMLDNYLEKVPTAVLFLREHTPDLSGNYVNNLKLVSHKSKFKAYLYEQNPTTIDTKTSRF